MQRKNNDIVPKVEGISDLTTTGINQTMYFKLCSTHCCDWMFFFWI